MIHLNVSTLSIYINHIFLIHANDCDNNFYSHVVYRLLSLNNIMRKIVVAITGASGSVYAKSLLYKLSQLRDHWTELGIIMSANAQEVWQTELGDDSYKSLPGKLYASQDFSAPFASGSGQYDTMIIIPCSMGTLGRIASGISNDLTTRACGCDIKRKKKAYLCNKRYSLQSYSYPEYGNGNTGRWDHLPGNSVVLQQTANH